MRRVAICLLCAISLVLGGCADDGVSSGATVSVYVAEPLCGSAKRELAREGGRAGERRIRAVCLPSAREGGELDLAALAANARRATEDSTSVAYLEAPDPRAARFTHPILEAADLALTQASSGEIGMRRILHAIAQADRGSLRESILDSLSGS